MRSAGTNFFFLSSAEILSKGIGFLTMAYLARSIGVDGFGEYGFVLAVYTYFALAANPGYDIIGARETARSEKKPSEILSSFFILKAGSSLLSYALLVLVCMFGPFSPATARLLLLQGLALFTIPFSIQFFFRGNNQMHIVAISRFMQSLLYFILVYFGVRDAGDLPRVPAFFALSTALALVPLVGMLRKNFRWQYRAPWKELRTYFMSAITVGAASLCVQVYLNMDTVLLGLFRTQYEVGLYTGAYKIITLASAIPGLLFTSYLPSLTALKDKGRREWKSFVLIMLVVGFSTSTLIGLYAPEIIFFLYGTVYAGAAVPLRLLSVDIAAVFISITFAQPLLLIGKEKEYLSIVAWSAGINLLLNVFLIPAYGMTGAALTTIAAEALVAVRSWKALTREAPLTFTKEVRSILWMSGCALLILAGCIFVLSLGVQISGMVFIGSYGAMILNWYLKNKGK